MQTSTGLIIALYPGSDCGLISIDGDRDKQITFFSDALLQPVCEHDRVQVTYGEDCIATAVTKIGEGKKPRNPGKQTERKESVSLGRGTVSAIYDGFGTIQAGDTEIVFLTRLCPQPLAKGDTVAFDFETVKGKHRATRLVKLDSNGKPGGF